MKKRTASRLLAGTLLAAVLPISVGTVPAAGIGNTFTDVTPGVWYAGAVSYVYDNGLMIYDKKDHKLREYISAPNGLCVAYTPELYKQKG